MSKVIGIDVDLTVVESDMPWFMWLIEVTDYNPKLNSLPYNLTLPFKDKLEEKGIDGHDWWRKEGLYDDLSPYKVAVEVINYWKEIGHKVVFISMLKGNHHKSKYSFLKRHFQFDGFIGTKEKHFCNVDVMIDDRLESFKGFPDSVSRHLVPTPYNGGTTFFNRNRDINKFWECLKTSV